MKFIPILLLAVLLSGCASHIVSAENVRDETTVTLDKYGGVTVVKAPTIQLKCPPFNMLSATLSAEITNDCSVKDAILRLEYMDQYGANHFWGAQDSNAKKLTVVGIDYEEGTHGAIYEKLSVVLDEKYIEEHTHSGFDMKILGKRASLLTKTPALYVEGFSKKLDEAIASCKGQPSN